MVSSAFQQAQKSALQAKSTAAKSALADLDSAIAGLAVDDSPVAVLTPSPEGFTVSDNTGVIVNGSLYQFKLVGGTVVGGKLTGAKVAIAPPNSSVFVTDNTSGGVSSLVYHAGQTVQITDATPPTYWIEPQLGGPGLPTTDPRGVVVPPPPTTGTNVPPPPPVTTTGQPPLPASEGIWKSTLVVDFSSLADGAIPSGFYMNRGPTSWGANQGTNNPSNQNDTSLTSNCFVKGGKLHMAVCPQIDPNLASQWAYNGSHFTSNFPILKNNTAVVYTGTLFNLGNLWDGLCFYGFSDGGELDYPELGNAANDLKGTGNVHQFTPGPNSHDNGNQQWNSQFVNADGALHRWAVVKKGRNIGFFRDGVLDHRGTTANDADFILAFEIGVAKGGRVSTGDAFTCNRVEQFTLVQ